MEVLANWSDDDASAAFVVSVQRLFALGQAVSVTVILFREHVDEVPIAYKR